jgi:hypothetical protein
VTTANAGGAPPKASPQLASCPGRTCPSATLDYPSPPITAISQSTLARHLTWSCRPRSSQTPPAVGGRRSTAEAGAGAGRAPAGIGAEAGAGAGAGAGTGVAAGTFGPYYPWAPRLMRTRGVSMTLLFVRCQEPKPESQAEKPQSRAAEERGLQKQERERGLQGEERGQAKRGER